MSPWEHNIFLTDFQEAIPAMSMHSCIQSKKCLLAFERPEKLHIMLIQHAEKKENSSSKRYKMSKCKPSFGDAILVTDWNTVPATWA